MSLISTVSKKSRGFVTMHSSEITPLWASLWALKKPPWSPAGCRPLGLSWTAGTEMLVGKVML